MLVLAFLERNRPEDLRNSIAILSTDPTKSGNPVRPQLSRPERSTGGILDHRSSHYNVHWHGSKW